MQMAMVGLVNIQSLNLLPWLYAKFSEMKNYTVIICRLTRIYMIPGEYSRKKHAIFSANQWIATLEKMPSLSQKVTRTEHFYQNIICKLHTLYYNNKLVNDKYLNIKIY